jgi:hypothetical protein
VLAAEPALLRQHRQHGLLSFPKSGYPRDSSELHQPDGR